MPYAIPPPQEVIIRFSIAASHMLPLVAHVFIAPTKNSPTPQATPDTIKPIVVESTQAKGITEGKAPNMNKRKEVPPATTGDRTSSSITPNSSAIIIFNSASGFDA